MKITSKTLLVPLLFYLAIFIGCSDEPSCPDAKEEYRYMPEEYKQILPYTGFDTLRFLTNTNDTITCIGQGRTTFFEANYLRDPNPDCNVLTKINYEGYKDNYGGIIIEQGQSPIASYNNAWYRNFKINWMGNIISFYTTYIGAKDGDSTDSSYKYHDSIMIKNYTYSNVSEFTDIKGNQLFINKQNGILQLNKITNNIFWVIIK